MDGRTAAVSNPEIHTQIVPPCRARLLTRLAAAGCLEAALRLQLFAKVTLSFLLLHLESLVVVKKYGLTFLILVVDLQQRYC